ncbi:MAG: hypothetical protein Harvfovirus22_14 [Harvfovirus sp.]|uniref:Uncharacterized protein n=1 Tax=Harvfovirus sp. TaxID=2487768 RepID=A0A3G5A702_9VIRU|nr:MAG: hypothetical protein Harvfovirus22_14 [Harvfovirus sp.]
MNYKQFAGVWPPPPVDQYRLLPEYVFNEAQTRHAINDFYTTKETFEWLQPYVNYDILFDELRWMNFKLVSIKFNEGAAEEYIVYSNDKILYNITRKHTDQQTAAKIKYVIRPTIPDDRRDYGFLYSANDLTDRILIPKKESLAEYVKVKRRWYPKIIFKPINSRITLNEYFEKNGMECGIVDKTMPYWQWPEPNADDPYPIPIAEYVERIEKLNHFFSSVIKGNLALQWRSWEPAYWPIPLPITHIILDYTF